MVLQGGCDLPGRAEKGAGISPQNCAQVFDFKGAGCCANCCLFFQQNEAQAIDMQEEIDALHCIPGLDAVQNASH